MKVHGIVKMLQDVGDGTRVCVIEVRTPGQPFYPGKEASKEDKEEYQKKYEAWEKSLERFNNMTLNDVDIVYKE